MPLSLHRPMNYSSPVLHGYYGNEHKPYIQGLFGLGIAPGDINFVGPLTPAQSSGDFNGPGDTAGITNSQLNDIKNFFYQAGQDNTPTGNSFNLNSITSWLQQNLPMVLIGIVGLTLLSNVSNSGGGRRK